LKSTSILIQLFITLFVLNIHPVSRKNFKYVEYEGFPEKHSTWGSIGYSSKYDKVIIGVTDHLENIVVFEYDCKKGKMHRRAGLNEDGHLQRFMWQGKIHSQILENRNDGWMYWGTDGGESREEYYMDHPRGYIGGFFMKYHPQTQEMKVLGRGRRYESIKDITIDQTRNRIYGVSYPSNHFLIKDLKTNTLIDKGVVNKAHVGRVVFTDDWGNGYYADMRGHLVKYEAHADSFIFDENPISRHKLAEAHVKRSGLRSWARDGDMFYVVTAWEQLFCFKQKEKGLPAIKDMGLIFDENKELDAKAILGGYTPNMACARNHKIYYWVGGHNKYFYDSTSVLVELDPKTNKKEMIYKAHMDEVSECTGSHIVDKRGNIYFAARRHVKGKEAGESGSSEPYMMIFNPEREIQ
jgi:hypothetical protein